MGKKFLLFLTLLCTMTLMTQAQTKVCMSYAEYKANQWKPYESLTEDKMPDSCRIKYDGIDFSIKTDDKSINEKIKKEVFLMNVDGQLFINSRPLRDEDRDHANREKALSLGAQWLEAGYQVISMRDDFKTIYGDGVEKTEFTFN